MTHPLSSAFRNEFSQSENPQPEDSIRELEKAHPGFYPQEAIEQVSYAAYHFPGNDPYISEKDARILLSQMLATTMLNKRPEKVRNVFKKIISAYGMESEGVTQILNSYDSVVDGIGVEDLFRTVIGNHAQTYYKYDTPKLDLDRIP